jgi:hypothetical protein
LGAAQSLEEPHRSTGIREGLDAFPSRRRAGLDNLKRRLDIEVNMPRAHDELVTSRRQAGADTRGDQPFAVSAVIREQAGGGRNEDPQAPSHSASR